MTSALSHIFHFFNGAVFVFAVGIMLSYLLLAILAAGALRRYNKKVSFTDYAGLLPSELAPGISLIAPAYNEGKTIEENVRSLLALHYNLYEVIIVNDGSRDDSIQILRTSYDLELCNFFVNPRIKGTKDIRGVYKSRNPAFSKLLVVDKQNGGKADALNVGINCSSYPYIACIDVDCVLEQDALQKMIKPFMDFSSKRVIATGGVVRIVNSCIVKSGRLIKTHLPEKFIARVQVLEYFRAFLLGRMAWSRLDGLLLISGAFGMFDKEIVIAAGGYDHSTVGEDMELVVRMRRYMMEQGTPHTVRFIPDPLCWTEAPENFKILGKQRSRWTRGTMETLQRHRKMIFNPRYGIVGMISLPYWLFFEYLAPLIELGGLIFTLVLAFVHLLYFKIFLLLLLFVYCFAVMFSLIAIMAEEFTFRQYEKRSDMMKLVLTALLEPLFFHPFTVYAALQGNLQKIRGKSSWGEMTRTGFKRKN